MKELLREFFGFGGYCRPAEGYMSRQHLLFVTCLMFVMVAFAVILGKKYRNREAHEKNKVIIVSAILIDAIELFKIVLCCFRANDPMNWVQNLPLFLCSIQLIALPLAAFSKGRVKEASLDFVVIFGLLGAVMGTYFAGQNYGCYPVLSFDNVVSGVTHSISGFASLYLLISKGASMKRKNIVASSTILTCFCIAAYAANILIDYNYMFLMRGDGTPYDILYNLFEGNRILYPLSVIGLFFIYIAAYYQVYYMVEKHKAAKEQSELVKTTV